MQKPETDEKHNLFAFKSEIITIDDETPIIDSDEIILDVPANIQNDISNGICYYFEPQQSTSCNTKPEKKTENFKISCPECPVNDSKILFDDRLTFELHYKKAHKAQVKFGCVSCDYNSKKFNLLKNHSKKHIVRKYECNECLKTYSQKSELNHHKTTEHKLKICRKCNLEFHDLEAYLEHKTTHNVVQPKSKTATPLECPDCKKVLMTQGGLFTHRKMHLEKPKFKCQTCEKSFFQKVNLINHTKTHNIQNKSFSCEQCDKKFFEKSHLQRHQNFHSVSRDYECSECGKFYKTERCLKVHKQVHSPYRPYRCEVCQKGFLSSSKLKQHGNIHTNNRPFLCKHCPRDFTNYPNLLKHTIRRHKVDHRTGLPLAKIPDYVTNKKKKKNNDQNEISQMQEKDLSISEYCKQELNDINVIQIPDDDLLPSSSGLMRGFHLNDGDSSIQNYDSMSILMDIDQEFSDFQLLSPSHDGQEDQFSIIDATDLQFFSSESSINNSNMIQLVRSNQ